MKVSAECELKDGEAIYSFEASGRYNHGWNEPPSLDDLVISPVVRFENDDDAVGHAVIMTPALQTLIEKHAVDKLFDAVENSRSSE